MIVDGFTKTIGLIGNPVGHTLSPLIHNGVSEKLFLSGRLPERKGSGSYSVYLPFEVSADNLQAAVQGAFALGVQGLNVTVPYKQMVMDCTLEVDEAADRIGAVNTLVRMEDGTGFKGYNTDWEGLHRQLSDDGISLKGRTAVILGAGGAARAVLYLCLSELAEKVYILNRTEERAVQLAEEFGQMGHIVPMKLGEAGKIKEDGLIVFQATSIGLFPNINDVVLEDEGFYSHVAEGIDLIYNPARTRFMQLVEAQGGRAFNALKMLLYQGIRAYELWFGFKVPEDVISDILKELMDSLYSGQEEETKQRCSGQEEEKEQAGRQKQDMVDSQRQPAFRNNLILTGFMGSGKTTVGRILADRLKMEFLDTDALIEQREGRTISEIFAQQGEAEFRRMETELLRKLQGTLTNTVLSTGGGMPLREENAQLLRTLGEVVYLSASPELIYERLKDQTDRPLLNTENPLARISSLMKERKARYEAACSMRVDTGLGEPEIIADKVIDELCASA